MKLNRIILYSLLLSMVGAPGLVFAQHTGEKQLSFKERTVRELVTARKYVFKAQAALPMNGRTRYLTSGYDLEVTPDTVEAYLPYFGRAYTAPMDPSRGGIEFVSTEFQYTLTELKKGGWKISIKPQDAREVQQLILTISSRGYASLQVISSRRQPISFNGRITGD